MVQLLNFSGPRGSVLPWAPGTTAPSPYPGAATPALARAGVLSPTQIDRHLSPLLPPSLGPRSANYIPGPSYEGWVSDGATVGTWAPICRIPPRSRLSRCWFYGASVTVAWYYALFTADGPLAGNTGYPAGTCVWPPIKVPGVITTMPLFKGTGPNAFFEPMLYYPHNATPWLLLWAAYGAAGPMVLRCTVGFDLEI